MTRKKPTRLDPPSSAEWLSGMLANAPQRVARHPSPEAVRRMRRRVLAQLARPAKAAA